MSVDGKLMPGLRLHVSEIEDEAESDDGRTMGSRVNLDTKMEAKVLS
jgi:hypothetical protein